MAKTVWRMGDDGLETREVGRWWDRKVAVVDYLSDMFSTGMKRRWDRRAYVELFAGPGRSWDRHRHVFTAGSAIRAMRFPYTDWAFVDLDPRATRPLRARLDMELHGDRAHVFTGDCNRAAGPIRDVIPQQRTITLAFVDPTAWEVRFDTIAELVEGRQTDLLVTFHGLRLERLAHLPNVAGVNDFFDGDEWMKIVHEAPRYRLVEELAALYNRKLSAIGYLESYQHRVPFQNTKNASLYQLIGFSKHPLGVKFWSDAAKANESGQRQLGLDV